MLFRSVMIDAMEILAAAREGRVHQVFIAEQAADTAERPPESGVHKGEDVLNLAAVEALSKGAEVWTFPGSSLAAVGLAGSPIAAMPRY